MAARNSSVEQEPPANSGGTQLITVNEEERNAMQEAPSQDSEGFVAPQPIGKKKRPGAFSKFCERSEFIYRPMEIKEGQKIRFVHEATMPSALARKEQIRTIMRKQYINRKVATHQNNVPLCRQYRIGELPDI